LKRPFPDEWEAILKRDFHHHSRLTVVECARLRDHLRVFIAEKQWEGCGGLAVTDQMKVVIAAQVSLLVLGRHDEFFPSVLSILVYPDTFRAPRRTVLQSGLVIEEKTDLEGQAVYRGPVIISWADALAGSRGEAIGHNLVIHEFAHQLDMQNGAADGIPMLATLDQHRRWQQVITSEYEQLKRNCLLGCRTLLDCYGATDRSEFFAVCTECFFERPRELRERHPELYELLLDYYCQDPASS
jgi:Mlc titration factor MtfA (ptsG expression regulator)